VALSVYRACSKNSKQIERRLQDHFRHQTILVRFDRPVLGDNQMLLVGWTPAINLFPHKTWMFCSFCQVKTVFPEHWRFTRPLGDHFSNSTEVQTGLVNISVGLQGRAVA
jgi:hypothetical protein